MNEGKDIRTFSTSDVIRILEQLRDVCHDAAVQGYQDATMSGLCHNGAWENAIGAIKMIDVSTLIPPASAQAGEA